MTTSELQRVKELERENRELSRESDFPEGISVFRPGGARPPRDVMVAFIDAHRDANGVEPICAQLPIAPSTYSEAKAREADPTRVSRRRQRDAQLTPETEREWRDNRRVYGAKKVWKEMNRQRIAVARCTVVRPMAGMGLRGVVRGRRVKTTIPALVAEREA